MFASASGEKAAVVLDEKIPRIGQCRKITLGQDGQLVSEQAFVNLAGKNALAAPPMRRLVPFQLIGAAFSNVLCKVYPQARSTLFGPCSWNGISLRATIVCARNCGRDR